MSVTLVMKASFKLFNTLENTNPFNSAVKRTSKAYTGKILPIMMSIHKVSLNVYQSNLR